jgi:hypothetical protein
MLNNVRGWTIVIIIVLVLVLAALLLWPARDPQEPVPVPGQPEGVSMIA